MILLMNRSMGDVWVADPSYRVRLRDSDELSGLVWAEDATGRTTPFDFTRRYLGLARLEPAFARSAFRLRGRRAIEVPSL